MTTFMRKYRQRFKEGDLVIIGSLDPQGQLYSWCGNPHRSHYYAMGVVIGKKYGDLIWTPGRSILTPTFAILLKYNVQTEHPGFAAINEKVSRILWNGHILAVDPGVVFPLDVPGFTHEIMAPVGELKI